MGTNYYLHRNICKHCRRGDKDPLHIGKSSSGWTFSFRGYRQPYEEPMITTWKEWREHLETALAKGDAEIRDECGDPVPLDELVALVDSKRDEENNHTLYCRIHHSDHAKNCWLDDEGHSFTGAWFS